MQIWVIITASLINLDRETRKKEYIEGINKVLKTFKDPKYKIVIVENSSKITQKFSPLHRTYLDQFNVPIFYTKNNIILKHTYNYGIIELLDLKECINYFGIKNDDFIIKITGRYELQDDCPFFDIVDKLEIHPYSAVVRYNQFCDPPSLERTHICTTGLIGLKCEYLKQIENVDFNENNTSIEINWAKAISSIDTSDVCILEKLGLLVKTRIKQYIYV
jgi:hypothetical protein